MTSRKVPSASFWMKTVTPGRAPPVSSVTDPRSSVVPCCARAGVAATPTSATMHRIVVSLRTLPLSFRKPTTIDQTVLSDADGDDDACLPLLLLDAAQVKESHRSAHPRRLQVLSVCTAHPLLAPSMHTPGHLITNAVDLGNARQRSLVEAHRHALAAAGCRFLDPGSRIPDHRGPTVPRLPAEALSLVWSGGARRRTENEPDAPAGRPARSGSGQPLDVPSRSRTESRSWPAAGPRRSAAPCSSGSHRCSGSRWRARSWGGLNTLMMSK